MLTRFSGGPINSPRGRISSGEYCGDGFAVPQNGFGGKIANFFLIGGVKFAQSRHQPRVFHRPTVSAVATREPRKFCVSNKPDFSVIEALEITRDLICALKIIRINHVIVPVVSFVEKEIVPQRRKGYASVLQSQEQVFGIRPAEDRSPNDVAPPQDLREPQLFPWNCGLVVEGKKNRVPSMRGAVVLSAGQHSGMEQVKHVAVAKHKGDCPGPG